jgi:hypothetical protein
VNALLWLTHVWGPELEAEFESLLGSRGPGMPEVWLLLDGRAAEAATLAARYPRTHVFHEAALFARPYPRIPKGDVRIHCHFPVFDFFLAHPEYVHYWLVEYDVRYTGAWAEFLGSFDACDHDLITSHIRRFADEPKWNWWRSLHHPTRTIPSERYLRSFNVIYRLSRRALAYLHAAQLDGWRGHPEVEFPTLLHEGGFRLLDFGGDGPFVPPGRRNRAYTCRGTRSGKLSPFATVTFRPSRARVGWRRNKLYHPVKPGRLREPLTARWREILRYARDVSRHGLGR